MPAAKKKGKGTAQSSGSKQGARQRAAAKPAAKQAEAPYNVAEQGEFEPLVNRDAVIVGGFEHTWEEVDQDGNAQTVTADLTGLRGGVADIESRSKNGTPQTARFQISSDQAGYVARPHTGDGAITVPWENLRRA